MDGDSIRMYLVEEENGKNEKMQGKDGGGKQMVDVKLWDIAKSTWL